MSTPFSVSKLGEFKVVVFQTVSLMNVPELERIAAALDRLADEQANGRVVLDFTKVEFFSSQAIGFIVHLNKKLSAVPGGKLMICGVSPQLTQLLKITRLDRILKVAKTQQDAVK